METLSFAELAPSILSENVRTGLLCDLVGLSTNPASTLFVALKEANLTSGLLAAVNNTLDDVFSILSKLLDVGNCIDPLLGVVDGSVDGGVHDFVLSGCAGSKQIVVQLVSPMDKALNQVSLMLVTLLSHGKHELVDGGSAFSGVWSFVVHGG